MARFTLDTKFKIGDLVYLKSDVELKGFVVGINLTQNLNFYYVVQFGAEEARNYYEFQLTEEQEFRTN